MKIVCTGGSGIVGGYLRTLFEQDGIEVVDYQKGVDVQAERFLHLAACTDGDAQSMIESNILLVKEVLDYCRNNAISEFIFFSDVSVYGRPNKEDLSETDGSGSIDMFGASKLFGEKLIAESGLKSLALRLPAILSRGIQGNVISRWYSALKANQELELVNPDREFNNFLFVENIFQFLRRLHPRDGFDVVNLAVNREMTVLEVATLLKRLLQSKSEICVDYAPHNFLNFSVEKAVKKYAFVPMGVGETLKKWCALNK